MNHVHRVRPPVRQPALPLTVVKQGLLVLACTWLVSQPGLPAAEPILGSRQIVPRRQPAPRAEQLPTSRVIEADAFTLLEGPRPDFAAAATRSVSPSTTAPGTSTAVSSTWSRLIAASTLTDEIKHAQLPLQQATASQTAFNGSIDTAVNQFSLVAVAFGLMAVHDDREGDLRSSWKKQAAALRDRFANAASACNREASKAFPEAQAAAQDLMSLIRGESISAPAASDQPFQWSQLCDRGVLMQRLKLADETLISGTASADAMAEDPDQLRHEAEIVAALGELIVQEAFIDWDDDTYREFATAMRDQAVSLQAALEKQDAEAARLTAKAVHQSCDACHQEYR